MSRIVRNDGLTHPDASNNDFLIPTFKDDFNRRDPLPMVPGPADPILVDPLGAWNIVTTGFGALAYMPNRTNGWWRLQIPPNVASSVLLVTKNPVAAPGDLPSTIFRIKGNFTPGFGPETDGVTYRSSLFCGLTDDPTGLFGNGYQWRVPDTFGVVPPVWQAYAAIDLPAMTSFTLGRPSEDSLDPGFVGAIINTQKIGIGEQSDIGPGSGPLIKDRDNFGQGPRNGFSGAPGADSRDANVRGYHLFIYLEGPPGQLAPHASYPPYPAVASPTRVTSFELDYVEVFSRRRTIDNAAPPPFVFPAPP